ncbi:MAG TPA: J domain-containing protein [Pirellulales bacterium]
MAAAADDYYEVLGVGRTATPEEIQKAFRRLARKLHPDVNPDDKKAKEKFQKLQNAYSVLNDPEKRELYDRYGAAFEQYSAAGARPGAGPGGPGGGFRPGGAGGPGGQGFEDFSDLFSGGGGFGGGGGGFEDLFEQLRRPQGRGRAAGGRRAAKSAEPTHEITILFATAVSGGETRLVVGRPNGQTETLTVKIPVGLEDGQKIRLKGQGDLDHTGEPGDLVILVKTSPHRFFTRQGQDLSVRLPITLAEAAAGAKVEVPTPTGAVMLRVPAGASSGMKLRIKGHGVPATKSKPAGDVFVELQIKMPPGLTPEEIKTIEEIEQKHPIQPRQELAW